MNFLKVFISFMLPILAFGTIASASDLKIGQEVLVPVLDFWNKEVITDITPNGEFVRTTYFYGDKYHKKSDIQEYRHVESFTVGRSWSEAEKSFHIGDQVLVGYFHFDMSRETITDINSNGLIKTTFQYGKGNSYLPYNVIKQIK